MRSSTPGAEAASAERLKAGHRLDLAELLLIKALQFLGIQQSFLHQAGKNEQYSIKPKIKSPFNHVALDAEKIMQLPKGKIGFNLLHLLAHGADQPIDGPAVGNLKGCSGHGLFLLRPVGWLGFHDEDFIV